MGLQVIDPAGERALSIPVSTKSDGVQAGETETGEQENEDKDMNGIDMEQFIFLKWSMLYRCV